jgi:hypothetical protein
VPFTRELSQITEDNLVSVAAPSIRQESGPQVPPIRQVARDTD